MNYFSLCPSPNIACLLRHSAEGSWWSPALSSRNNGAIVGGAEPCEKLTLMDSDAVAKPSWWLIWKRWCDIGLIQSIHLSVLVKEAGRRGHRRGGPVTERVCVWGDWWGRLTAKSGSVTERHWTLTRLTDTPGSGDGTGVYADSVLRCVLVQREFFPLLHSQSDTIFSLTLTTVRWFTHFSCCRWSYQYKELLRGTQDVPKTI